MLLLGQSGEFAFQVSTETPVFLEDKGFFLEGLLGRAALYGC